MSWVDIADFVEVPVDFGAYPGGAARVSCHLWARDTGVTVQARLYDVDGDASLGESAEVTATTPTEATFTVTGSGVKTVRLQVTSATTGADLFCIGEGLVP